MSLCQCVKAFLQNITGTDSHTRSGIFFSDSTIESRISILAGVQPQIVIGVVVKSYMTLLLQSYAVLCCSGFGIYGFYALASLWGWNEQGTSGIVGWLGFGMGCLTETVAYLYWAYHPFGCVERTEQFIVEVGSFLWQEQWFVHLSIRVVVGDV